MKTTAAVCLCLLAIPGVAFSQKIEIAPFAGYFRPNKAGLGSLQETAKDNHTTLRSGQGFGVRGTWNTAGYYGFELGATQFKPVFSTVVRPAGASADVRRDTKINERMAFFNALAYMMPLGERFRPFITVGAMLQQFGRPNVAEFDGRSSRNYGVNYGGGLKVKLFDHALIRLDVREYMGGRPYDLKRENERDSGGRLRQLEASVGIGITF